LAGEGDGLGLAAFSDMRRSGQVGRRGPAGRTSILHCSITAVKAPGAVATYNPPMYIVAIGWIYVTLLMALTETNVTAAILTFCLYGLAPLALLLWLFGTPQRRRAARQGAADSMREAVPPAADGQVGQPDGGDAKSDQ
jgi:hypothetical protein